MDDIDHLNAGCRPDVEVATLEMVGLHGDDLGYMLVSALGYGSVYIGFHGARIHCVQALDCLGISYVHAGLTLHWSWGDANILNLLAGRRVLPLRHSSLALLHVAVFLCFSCLLS